METETSCVDFLIAAIRHLRRTCPNVTPGTQPGTPLGWVAEAAQEVYPDEVIRESLKELLTSGQVIILAGSVHLPGHKNRVHLSVIPDDVPLTLWSGWYLKPDGSGYCERYRNPKGYVTNIRAYVTEDGLSRTARRVVGTKKTNAQAILSTIAKA